MPEIIIGLTGKNAAGKGETANYLKSKGFIYFSLSDALRDEATKRGVEHSRSNLINLGNELRAKFGPGYLAEQISEKIANSKKKLPEKNFFVIDSVRSPYEAKELMKNNGFVLVGVDTPAELRFKRLLERNRLGDAKTLEEFKGQEQRENLKSNTNQQLDETFKIAKYIVANDGTIEELHRKIDELLKKLKWQG